MNSTVKNKEKLQNTKKTKGILKRFNYFVLSLIILLSSFSFSFANGDMPVYVSKPSYDEISTSPVYCYFYDRYNYYASSSSLLDYFYLFDEYNSLYYFYVAYDNSSNVSLNLYTGYNNTVAQASSNNWSTISNYKYKSLYSDSFIPLYNTFVYLGSFTDSSAGLNYYIQNGVQYNEPIKYPYTFQNGYLFVYDLGSSNTMYSFDLLSKSEEYSNVGSNPFPDTNQSYWFSDTLPEIDETTIPSTSSAIINWQKGDITNIFGQTQDMKSTINGTSTGRYLYIYNPPAHYKWSGSSNPTASEVVNYPLTIYGVSSGDNFYVYDSAARLYDFNQGGRIEGTIVGEIGYGSVSSDGAISVITTDGAIFNQSSGGSTDISSAAGGSIAENINGLKQTLDDFVNQFIQLLSAPISHIQQLISTGHNFIDVFSQFFSWLPTEVVSVIVSGMIILVVVGVLKLLL